jgi:hypothetical protein
MILPISTVLNIYRVLNVILLIQKFAGDMFQKLFTFKKNKAHPYLFRYQDVKQGVFYFVFLIFEK